MSSFAEIDWFPTQTPCLKARTSCPSSCLWVTSWRPWKSESGCPTMWSSPRPAAAWSITCAACTATRWRWSAWASSRRSSARSSRRPSWTGPCRARWSRRRDWTGAVRSRSWCHWGPTVTMLWFYQLEMAALCVLRFLWIKRSQTLTWKHLDSSPVMIF